MAAAGPHSMTLTLSNGGKQATLALRPDTAEYLLATRTVDPTDWRIRDLILAAWAVAQQLR